MDSRAAETLIGVQSGLSYFKTLLAHPFPHFPPVLAFLAGFWLADWSELGQALHRGNSEQYGSTQSPESLGFAYEGGVFGAWNRQVPVSGLNRWLFPPPSPVHHVSVVLVYRAPGAQSTREPTMSNGNAPTQPPVQRHKRPRLDGDGSGVRTAIACRACRERKTRCSGHQPACTYCLKTGLLCVYATTVPTYTPWDS